MAWYPNRSAFAIILDLKSIYGLNHNCCTTLNCYLKYTCTYVTVIADKTIIVILLPEGSAGMYCRTTLKTFKGLVWRSATISVCITVWSICIRLPSLKQIYFRLINHLFIIIRLINHLFIITNLIFQGIYILFQAIYLLLHLFTASRIFSINIGCL